MCSVVVLLRAHSMNSSSKNIVKLPSETMNGGNTWNQCCWKSGLSLFCSITNFWRKFVLCIKLFFSLSLLLSQHVPQFSALCLNTRWRRVKRWVGCSLPPFSYFVSLIFKSSETTPVLLGCHNHRAPHTIYISCCFSCKCFPDVSILWFLYS